MINKLIDCYAVSVWFTIRQTKLDTAYRQLPNFFFFHSILRWSVAVSTMRRQSSRMAAFLQADARPMFCWPRSTSTARSQVWLARSLPNGRNREAASGSPQRQHGGGPFVVSCGQCPKSRKRLSVSRWERRRHPVVALTSTFVT